MNIDDIDRGRKGVEEMLVRMSKMTDMPDNPKQNTKRNSINLNRSVKRAALLFNLPRICSEQEKRLVHGII